MLQSKSACPRAVCRPLQGDLDALLSREWLLTNGRGGFAMGTVVGCPTRRYHGMMVMSRRPPLERWMLLSGTLDRVTVGEFSVDLSTMEFDGEILPTGHIWLKDFDYQLARPTPWVQWTFAHELFEARKRLTLFSDEDVIRLRYDISTPQNKTVELQVCPMVALRDFHRLRRHDAHDAVEPWELHTDGKWLWVQDREQRDITLTMVPQEGPGLTLPRFYVLMEWWHAFHYRAEYDRGEPATENLMRAGEFRASGVRSVSVELMGVGFATSPADAQIAAEKALIAHIAEPRPDKPIGMIRRHLHDAADQFVVKRQSHRPGNDVTIIAGYPWFGDWGRDSFIAMEGLLLVTERFAEARKVLATFAGAVRHGLIPNRFDDYGGECAYNSVDASLWFVHAADRYSTLSGDAGIWANLLADPCRDIVDGFVGGTLYNIHVDDCGLVGCGDANTQITWMDALCDEVAFTPRHGCPVEVNALWYNAMRILEQRLAGVDDATAAKCKELADKTQAHFIEAFWGQAGGCLYDCVRPDFNDDAVRPNQIFAVSLPHTLLSPEHQRAVLEVVTEHLLTPYGLRTLDPRNPHYHPQMVGTRFERDRAYHNGTVWSWLIGPYVDAYFRVHGETDESLVYVYELITPLLSHMSVAGLGSISEVFDGDPPHTPRGCIAQAWSVAEVLRIKHRLDQKLTQKLCDGWRNK
ncbi:MAG: glycogen debranching enzyme N-terminal domain-containing protein [Phycisphaerae bacterium]|nr:glycogen debranching enzyme N-terminal domain-containing protein [Phycisphaerae bacterium]